MTTSPHAARLGAALLAAVAATVLAAGSVLAHPESEGDHPSGCIVTVEPGSVAVGQQFTVSGNFGGASIFIVAGADASPAESECGDGDALTVTALPNTAAEPPSEPALLAGLVLLLTGLAFGVDRAVSRRR